jgi:integrase
MKFTTKSIAALALPAGKSDHTAWDDDLPNFGIRLRLGGSKTWTIFYRIGVTQRRESLGDCRKLDLDAARKIARQRFAQLELGIDPQAAKNKARADAAVSKLTLAVAVERYLDYKQAILRPSSHAAAQHYFAVHWKPFLDRPLETIRRLDVASRLQEVAKRHGRVSASRARANLSSLLGWAMREGLIESNVVVGTNNPAPPSSRERVLSAPELAAVWNACGGDDDHSRIVRLLILTGQRRDEVGWMMWDELDLDNAVWRIPGSRAKNHRDHDVPLSPQALSILRALNRRERPYVFGRDDSSGFGGWSNRKRVLDASIAATWPSSTKPFEHWTLHDLRRTTATRMADIGIQPHVIEAVLNHVSGSKRGPAGIYNRSTYSAEKRQALDRWSAHVEALVSGEQSNIVALKALA